MSVSPLIVSFICRARSRISSGFNEMLIRRTSSATCSSQPRNSIYLAETRDGRVMGGVEGERMGGGVEGRVSSEKRGVGWG